MGLAQRLESPLVGDIIELSLATDIQNKGWIKKIMLRMLGRVPEELAFRVQRYSYGRGERLEKFKNVFNRVSDSAKSLVGDPFLFKAWDDKIEKSLNGRSGGGDWSLAEIRKRLRVKQMDGQIWNFLFQKSLSRTSTRESSLLLKKRMDEEFIENMKVSDIWLFGYYYPTQAPLRKKALNKIHSAWMSKDFWLKYLVVRLIKNPVLKKGLAERSPLFKKALFQIERQVYRKLLSQGRAVDFALYNLIQLGDYDRRDLWWLVL